MAFGLVLSGAYVDATPRVRDGQQSGWYVLIVCGMDSYRVLVRAVPDGLSFGQSVRLSLHVSCYNGKLFYNGDFIDGEV